MKQVVITLSLVFSIQAMAAGLNSIKRLKVPNTIHKAVEDNYEYGRDYSDFGGVHGIRYFQGKPGSFFGNLKSVLNYLIKNEKGNAEVACFEMNLTECAEEFAREDRSAFFDLIIDGAISKKEKKFNKDLRAIRNFIDHKLPNAYDLSVCGDGLNVDICTDIFIDKFSGKIIAVEWDYGA